MTHTTSLTYISVAAGVGVELIVIWLLGLVWLLLFAMIASAIMLFVSRNIVTLDEEFKRILVRILLIVGLGCSLGTYFLNSASVSESYL